MVGGERRYNDLARLNGDFRDGLPGGRHDGVRERYDVVLDRDAQ